MAPCIFLRIYKLNIKFCEIFFVNHSKGSKCIVRLFTCINLVFLISYQYIYDDFWVLLPTKWELSVPFHLCACVSVKFINYSYSLSLLFIVNLYILRYFLLILGPYTIVVLLLRDLFAFRRFNGVM